MNIEKLEHAKKMRLNPTPAERELLKIINTKIAPTFPDLALEIQSVQCGYILDYYYPAIKLGIEVDGHCHDEKHMQDELRDLHLLKREGIYVIRIRNDEVFNAPSELAQGFCDIIIERKIMITYG